MVNIYFLTPQAAANCYIELIVKESDNNVKLIVLDRLVALKDTPQQEKILQDLAMDVLRILATPDLEVRKKTLNLGKSNNNLFTSYFPLTFLDISSFSGKMLLRKYFVFGY